MRDIAAYTLRTWGEQQATQYIGTLEACCQGLANNPALGRVCDNVRPGLRCMEHGHQVVFYKEEAGGILVSRVLHQRMLPERQSVDEEGDDNMLDQFGIES